MTRGAGRRPSKLGFLGLLGGGVAGNLMHIIDPPQWVVVVIEAVLAVVVALLLTAPRSPQTPNLNLIPIIH